MEDTNISEFVCKTHNLSFDFMCTANQWHFICLCSQCIPQHTQKHSKNVKVHIQNLNKVKEKAKLQIQKAINLYNQKLQKLNSTLSIQQNDFYQIKIMNQTQIAIIEQINKHFDKLRNQYLEEIKGQDTYNHNQLIKLKDNLTIKVSQLNKLNDKIFNQQWVEKVRSIYFKDDIQVYCEQIEEFISQYMQNVVKKCNEIWKNKENISEKIKQIFVQFQKEKDKKIIEKQKVSIIKPKLIIKKRKCPDCNQQMEYLTDLKKHLVCKNCGGKERNYTKKIQ